MLFHIQHVFDFMFCAAVVQNTVIFFLCCFVSVSGCLPHIVINGSHSPSLTEHAFDSTITYDCVTGYNITSGDATSTCQTDGTWNGTLPTCSSEFI